MIEVFEDIRGEKYQRLIAYLLNKCDTFTFCLPDFGKRAYFHHESGSFLDKYYVSSLDDGLPFQTYKTRVAPKVELVKDHLRKVFCDIKYCTNLYDREREIYVVKIDSSLNADFFASDGLSEWRYPNFPEDICFYKNGQCFIETVTHEQCCFFYLEDDDLLKLLDNLDIEYWENTCDAVPTLEY